MKRKFSLTILFSILVSAASGATADGLPFLEDNSAQAINQAKQRKLPIFVEVSAPW
jgi:hypothetical protein